MKRIEKKNIKGSDSLLNKKTFTFAVLSTTGEGTN